MQLSDIHTIQMTAVFALIIVALVLYASERLSYELSSLIVLSTLLVLFHFLPVEGLTPKLLLSGFANPALIAVLALLVVGQGLATTGALGRGAWAMLKVTRGHAAGSIALSLVVVAVVSAFLNNTPVVLIFIPIMQSLAEKIRRGPGFTMMPLSFAAILGGMTTLLGSSTNLLVSGTLTAIGEEPLGFFDFLVPAATLAAVGLVYLLFLAPRLLPDRGGGETSRLPISAKQFVAQITISEGSALVGERPHLGAFTALPQITVLMIQRRERAFLPPFEGVELTPGDIVVIAATRQSLTEALEGDPALLFPDIPEPSFHRGEDDETPWTSGEQTIAEVMVPPNSPLVGRTLERIGFRYRYRCIVLGIERRSRMLRRRITDIPLEGGDVLLIQGRDQEIKALRGSRDVLLMEWSAAALPTVRNAKRAFVIFAAVVLAAATGFLPIAIAALAGAAAMIGTGVLTLREAFRALDSRIVMLVATALALGEALQFTDGATFLAESLIGALRGNHPAVIMSGLFLLVALMTNLVTNNAMAVLFTPIAVGMAARLGVPVEPFAITVLLAANCSFATPIGYQTNLLVMVPGRYRFMDFVKAGLPLLLILWLVFSLFAPWYYVL
jgi:di/tricarboxylate transporter